MEIDEIIGNVPSRVQVSSKWASVLGSASYAGTPLSISILEELIQGVHDSDLEALVLLGMHRTSQVFALESGRRTEPWIEKWREVWWKDQPLLDVYVCGICEETLCGFKHCTEHSFIDFHEKFGDGVGLYAYEFHCMSGMERLENDTLLVLGQGLLPLKDFNDRIRTIYRQTNSGRHLAGDLVTAEPIKSGVYYLGFADGYEHLYDSISTALHGLSCEVAAGTFTPHTGIM